MPLRHSRETITLPIFATYIFINLDLSPVWQMVRRQPGVINVLLTGDQPSRCPESEILKLKASEIDGLVQLGNEPPPRCETKFAKGEGVKIGLEAFRGRPAEYVKPTSQRMSIILVTLLNRVVSVRIPTHLVSAIAAS